MAASAMVPFSASSATSDHRPAEGLSVPGLGLIRYGVAGPLLLVLLLRIGLGGLARGWAAALPPRVPTPGCPGLGCR
jgi:hypothetical protein